MISNTHTAIAAFTEQGLDQVIRQPGAIADRQFENAFFDSGVQAFAFMFG